MGIREYIDVLNLDKKMSFQEIADFVGVEKYVVHRWKKGGCEPKPKNFEKVQEMVEILEKFEINYRKQAIDILNRERANGKV